MERTRGPGPRHRSGSRKPVIGLRLGEIAQVGGKDRKKGMKIKGLRGVEEREKGENYLPSHARHAFTAFFKEEKWFRPYFSYFTRFVLL